MQPRFPFPEGPSDAVVTTPATSVPPSDDLHDLTLDRYLLICHCGPEHQPSEL